MRVTFAKDQDGNWVASLRVPFDGSASCVAATPWAASASLCAYMGDDCEIAWHELPWAEKRIAYGIVMGIAELIGATPVSRDALDRAAYGDVMTACRVKSWREYDPASKANICADVARLRLRYGAVPSMHIALTERILAVAAAADPKYKPALALLRRVTVNWRPLRKRTQRMLDAARSAIERIRGW
jgi:hypothetical protein